MFTCSLSERIFESEECSCEGSNLLLVDFALQLIRCFEAKRRFLNWDNTEVHVLVHNGLLTAIPGTQPAAARIAACSAGSVTINVVPSSLSEVKLTFPFR